MPSWAPATAGAGGGLNRSAVIGVVVGLLGGLLVVGLIAAIAYLALAPPRSYPVSARAARQDMIRMAVQYSTQW